MANENNKRPPIPNKPQWLMRRSYSEHSFPKKEQKGSLVQQRLKQFSMFQNNDDEENERKPIDFGTDYNKRTSPQVKRRQTTNVKVIILYNAGTYLLKKLIFRLTVAIHQLKSFEKLINRKLRFSFDEV